jgi:glycine cleavage system H protein
VKVKGYDIPRGLFYMKEHMWLSLGKSKTARIGITDYAQKTLREINFVYLPKKEGLTVRRLQVVATVESVKALSEIYSPISGQVIDVNEELTSKPRLINQDPYGEGWIVLIRPDKFEEESKNLLKQKQYAEHVKKLTKIDKDLLVYRWRRKH